MHSTGIRIPLRILPVYQEKLVPPPASAKPASILAEAR